MPKSKNFVLFFILFYVLYTRKIFTGMQKVGFNYACITGISLTAGLGGILLGYNWVVIGGAGFFFIRSRLRAIKYTK